MAYLRDYTDPYGTSNETAYTHIQGYSINVRRKIAIIDLVTYTSKEAKDSKFKPIDQESETISGGDYEKMFGAESSTIILSGGDALPIAVTMNSSILKRMYDKLNETPKWQADNVTNVFEMVITNLSPFLINTEISRDTAWTGKLVEGVDFEGFAELADLVAPIPEDENLADLVAPIPEEENSDDLGSDLEGE